VRAVARTILWDFDGTLAHRPGRWRGCLIEVLDEQEPGHAVTSEELRPFLRNGFPWHRHETPHPELSTPEAWWGAVEPLLAGAYTGVGFNADRSRQLARYARERYVDPNHGWAVFDDVPPALTRLTDSGWRHVIVSNHMPELETLVSDLGLAQHFDRILTSAATGFEKPHPDAFETARQAAGGPSTLWMVGDNLDADVHGAESVGIPAILVRNTEPLAPRTVTSLDELDRLLPSHD
jgi:putative hydrolase of the HAD superfamily